MLVGEGIGQWQNLDEIFRGAKLNLLDVFFLIKKKLIFFSSFHLLKTGTHYRRIQKNITILRYYIMIPNHE